MKNQYNIYAGIINGITGTPIGLGFPIDVGYKTVGGPEAWRTHLKDMDTLFAEWTTFRAERDLLAAHIRGEITYEKVRHLVEEAQSTIKKSSLP